MNKGYLSLSVIEGFLRDVLELCGCTEFKIKSLVVLPLSDTDLLKPVGNVNNTLVEVLSLTRLCNVADKNEIETCYRPIIEVSYIIIAPDI